MERQAIGVRKLTNPLPEEFEFMWDGVPYIVPAMSTKSFADYIAIHGAKHLANKILIEKGRFEDIIRNDKRISHPVTAGEKQTLMDALLDRDDEVMNIDEVLGEVKGAEPRKQDTAGEVTAEIKEDPIVTEVQRFKVLQEKKWVNLKDEERKEYKILKDKITQ